MKQVLKLSISLLVVLLFYSSSSAFMTVSTQPNAMDAYDMAKPAKPSPFVGMTISDFFSLTPRKYRELTGKKLSLPQQLALKLAQVRVKKMVKKNRPVDLILMTREIDTNNFDILGFILGLVLGPLGVLIAYLLEGRSSSTFLWSVFGALIWLGIFLLVILVF
jgi:hypothetical protein